MRVLRHHFTARLAVSRGKVWTQDCWSRFLALHWNKISIVLKSHYAVCTLHINKYVYTYVHICKVPGDFHTFLLGILQGAHWSHFIPVCLSAGLKGSVPHMELCQPLHWEGAETPVFLWGVEALMPGEGKSQRENPMQRNLKMRTGRLAFWPWSGLLQLEWIGRTEAKGEGKVMLPRFGALHLSFISPSAT